MRLNSMRIIQCKFINTIGQLQKSCFTGSCHFIVKYGAQEHYERCCGLNVFLQNIYAEADSCCDVFGGDDFEND